MAAPVDLRNFQQTPDGGGYVVVQMKDQDGVEEQKGRRMQFDDRNRQGSLGTAAGSSPYQTQPHHYVATVNIGQQMRSNEPESGLNLYKSNEFMRQSEEFMLNRDNAQMAASRRRGVNRIDLKHSKQSSMDQSPHGQGSASPHQKFFNSTLHKSQISGIGRNLQDIAPAGSQSPDQTFIERTVLSGPDRHTLGGHLNESGESKYKEESRFNNATSPHDQSTILQVKDPTGKMVQSMVASEQRVVQASALKLSTQPTLPISEVNKQFDQIAGGIRQNQDNVEKAPGKIEVQVDKKREGSQSQQSAMENQSPGHPTIYQSSLKRANEQSVLTNQDQAKLSSTAKKDAGESNDSPNGQMKPHNSERAEEEGPVSGVDDPDKLHNGRLYVIQKMKKPGDAEGMPSATTPAEAYQTEPREQPGINQVTAAVPKIPELPEISDMATPHSQAHLQNMAKIGGVQGPQSMHQKQRDLHKQ